MRAFPRLSAWRGEALRTNLWLVPTAEVLCAVALFAAIKAINIMTRKAAKEPPPPAPPTQEVVLLTEIRDQLAKRGA